MRWIIGACLATALLWAGYWFVGSTAAERGVKAWFADRSVQGWVAEYDTVKTRGFPSRFDTTINALELADPRTGWVWSAPFFQVFALSYKPNHIIAVWPNEQTIATPLARANITTEDMRASAVFLPDTALTLDSATFTFDKLKVTGNGGTTIQFTNGIVSVRRAPNAELTHDFYAQLKDVTLPDDLRDKLDPANVLPRIIEGLTIDVTASFDAEWNRFAIEQARPQPTSIDLNLLAASWGGLDLRAAGDLTIDGSGIPTGEIQLKATNWREMLKLAEKSDIVPQGVLPFIERGLEMLAGLSGNTATLDIPMTFRKGNMAIGPFPIGPAPSIRLR
jgi:hypothetical protein